MSNSNALIAQLMSEFSNFRDYIDEDTLYRELVLNVKEFGNNNTEYFEDVIEIKKGKGALNSNFYKLDVALLVSDLTQSDIVPLEVRTLMDSDRVVELDVFKTKWIDCDSCCKERGYSSSERHLFYKEVYNGYKCYGRFEPLSVTKHTIRNCTKDCINKQFKSPKQISIDYRNLTLNTNFNNGSVFIRYKGFPVDEEGFLDYNDTANSNLERYLEYALKEKIAEMLIPIESARSVVSSMGFYSQKKQYYKLKAQQEKIFENFDYKEFSKKTQVFNRDYYLKLAVR